MEIKNNSLENGDLQIVLTFSAHDQICLEHDLIDIVQWYSTGPSAEKIANCRKRMIQDCKEQLLKSKDFQSMTMAEVNAVLEDEVKLCEMIKKMPEYKNRHQRD